MQRYAHTEELAERRELDHGCEASNIGHVDPNEIDEPVPDEREVPEPVRALLEVDPAGLGVHIQLPAFAMRGNASWI